MYEPVYNLNPKERYEELLRSAEAGRRAGQDRAAELKWPILLSLPGTMIVLWLMAR